MKLAASIAKTFKENIRDWKVLVLVLLFSPFFILLMKLFYGSETTTYKIAVLNLDRQEASSELIKSLAKIGGGESSLQFKLSLMTNDKDLKSAVKEKTIDLGVVIPEGYSAKLADFRLQNEDTADGKGLSGNSGSSGTVKPAMVEFYGSIGNPRYILTAIMASDAVYRQGMEIIKITLPTGIHETFLEKKLPVNEFDSFVPGLISMAVLMILFSAAGSIVKENDKKTLIRMKLSRLGSINFLAGICIVQAALAVIALVIAYWTALGLGYRPAGGFGSVLAVGIISSLSMVAVCLVVAAYLDTIFDVLTIGCFPFFILMFFSGAAFPLPKMYIFNVAGHPFAVNDILPLTHTANAFNKILNYGEGLGGAAYEIFMIILLTIIYFAVGMALYQKRKLSKA